MEKEKIDYRKYWERPNKELLSEVLDKTIDLDYLILKIIKKYFDLDLKFNENNVVTNYDKIINFSNLFMETGANTKLNLLKEIRKGLSGDKKTEVKDFDNKFRRIYDIRNIFAHSKLPKISSKKFLADPEKVSWEELHEEHKKVCQEIYLSLLAEDNKITI
jgi:hypothetical protein